MFPYPLPKFLVAYRDALSSLFSRGSSGWRFWGEFWGCQVSPEHRTQFLPEMAFEALPFSCVKISECDVEKFGFFDLHTRPDPVAPVFFAGRPDY